jgi:hypothetical protein
MIADYARGDARTVFVMPVSLSTRLGCCGIVESKPPCSFAASKKRESRTPGHGSHETNKINPKICNKSSPSIPERGYTLAPGADVLLQESIG